MSISTNPEEPEFPIYRQHRDNNGSIYIKFVSRGQAICLHKKGKRPAWNIGEPTSCAIYSDIIWSKWDGILPGEQAPITKVYRIKDYS